MKSNMAQTKQQARRALKSRRMRARYDRARNVVRNNKGKEYKGYILTPGDQFAPKAVGKFKAKKLKVGEKPVTPTLHSLPKFVPKDMVRRRVVVNVGKLIRYCNRYNSRYAWYESNVGPVRKLIRK